MRGNVAEFHQYHGPRVVLPREEAVPRVVLSGSAGNRSKRLVAAQRIAFSFDLRVEIGLLTTAAARDVTAPTRIRAACMCRECAWLQAHRRCNAWGKTGQPAATTRQ